MFKDYVNAVVKEYHDKVSSNTLSLNLTSLTPKNVKRECKDVCINRFLRSDERMLSAIFGYAENQNSYLQAIERCDIDKFRPMINFIQGISKDTDQKNVELLAWLIDFKDRPFDPNGKYGKLNQPPVIFKPLVGTTENSNINDNNQSPQAPITNNQTNSSLRQNILSSGRFLHNNKVAVAILIAIAFTGTIVFFITNNAKPANKVSNDSCMYWKDDHYEKISCSQKVKYSKVIALDSNLLNYFTKINVPETITYSSIGKVWYIKIKGELEFYTWMGYHPVLTHLQLKPLTKYIIDTHIIKKAMPNANAINSLRTSNITTIQPNAFNLLFKMRKKTTKAIYGQCRAITRAKSQCLRNADVGGFCWQHKK